MLDGLRIGYTPYRRDCSAAGDRRRFPFFAGQRNLVFETYDPSKTYDLLVVTLNSDLSSLSRLGPNSGKIIFDLPDSYLSSSPWLPSNWVKAPHRYLSGQWSSWEWSFLNVVRRMCRRADAIACSTPEQKKLLNRYSANVHDVLDFQSQEIDQQKQSFRSHSPFRIVWEGVGESLRGFLDAAEAISRLSQEMPIELHLFTDLFFRPMNSFRKLEAKKVLANILPGVPFYLYEWNASMLSTVASNCDLAIVPVDRRSPMNLAKPENRLLLFWRMAVPTITSSTPAYNRVAQTAGLPVTFPTQQAWYEGLKAYALDPDLRERNARFGAEYIQSHASDAILLDRWEKLVADLGLASSVTQDSRRVP